MKKAMSYISSLLIVLFFVVSCSTGGGTMNGGGNNNGTIALIAILGGAWYLGKNYLVLENSRPRFQPILIVEEPSDEVEKVNAASYVILNYKPDGRNRSRYIEFCNQLKDLLLVIQDQIDTRGRRVEINPVIWPVIESTVVEGDNCRFLVDSYDDRYITLINEKRGIPRGVGPVLVAFNGRIEDLPEDPNNFYSVHWDASEYKEEEFSDIVQYWDILMSRSPEVWVETLEKLVRHDRIERTLKSFD